MIGANQKITVVSASSHRGFDIRHVIGSWRKHGVSVLENGIVKKHDSYTVRIPYTDEIPPVKKGDLLILGDVEIDTSELISFGKIKEEFPESFYVTGLNVNCLGSSVVRHIHVTGSV